MNRKRLPKVRLLGKNKNELYVSFVIVVVGVLISSWKMPIDIFQVMVAVTSSVVGFFCALNAVLDADRMGPVERQLASAWLVLVSFWTIVAFMAAISTRAFSPA